MEPSTEDGRWIVEYQGTGDAESWGRLFHKYSRPVFIHCLKIVRNEEDARDLTSECFIRAFENMGKFDKQRPFYPWLRRIATNLSIDHVRRRSRVTLELLDEDLIPSPQDEPPDEEERRALRDRVAKTIKKLKRPQRRCFCLFYIQGRSYKEIAQITGDSLARVRSHIQNGRRRFRVLLEEAGYGV